MVLTALVAAGAGVSGVGAGTYLTWNRYPKPFILKKFVEALPGFISKSLAGSPCSVESVDFFAGLVSEIKLQGVCIGNLEPYKSTNMVKLDSIIIKVDMKSSAKSGFKHLIVDSLCIDGLILTVEKQGLTTSNVTDLLDKLQKKDSSPDGAVESNEPSLLNNGGDIISNVVDTSKQAVNLGAGVVEKGVDVAVSSAKAVKDKASGEKESTVKEKKMQVIVKTLEICGITLEAVSSLLDTQTPTMKLSVADIKYKDFSSHAGRPDHIVRVILEQIVVTSLTAAGGLGSIAVDNVTGSAWWIFEHMGEAMSSAYHSVASLFSSAEAESQVQ